MWNWGHEAAFCFLENVSKMEEFVSNTGKAQIQFLLICAGLLHFYTCITTTYSKICWNNGCLVSMLQKKVFSWVTRHAQNHAVELNIDAVYLNFIWMYGSHDAKHWYDIYLNFHWINSDDICFSMDTCNFIMYFDGFSMFRARGGAILIMDNMQHTATKYLSYGYYRYPAPSYQTHIDGIYFMGTL